MLESQKFFYAGKSSDYMGLINVSLGGGLFEEGFIASRQIDEVSTRGRDEPFFQGVRRDPLSFTLRFAFKDPYDEEQIRAVARWLDQDYYQPFYTNENQGRIFYCMLNGDSSLVHNGFGQGYIEVEMRCKTSHSFSPEYMTDVLDYSEPIFDYTESTQSELQTGTLQNLKIDANGHLTLDNLAQIGIKESEEIDLSPVYSAISPTISWEEVVDANASLKVEVSVSGSSWKQAKNGGKIPFLTNGSETNGKMLKVRMTFESLDGVDTAILYSFNINIGKGYNFVNDGDRRCEPEMWLTKVGGGGDITITNHFKYTKHDPLNPDHRDEVFRFTGLADGEMIYINNEREDIESDIPDTYRYDNFNDGFLSFPRGKNILEMSGNFKLQFRYSFKTIQG